jgi:hypothetical protein
MPRRLTMVSNGVAEHLGRLLDIEVADAEPERRDREVLDAPVGGSLQRAAHRLPHLRARDWLVLARHHTVNEKLDSEGAGGSDDGRSDGEWLVDPKMASELVTACDFQATHQRRRRAELGIDRPRDGIRFDEREIVGAYFDHSGPAQEMASDVSLLIQLRYFSSPAWTGIARSSGTL